MEDATTWRFGILGQTERPHSISDRLGANLAKRTSRRDEGANDRGLRDEFERELRPVLEIAYAAAYRLAGSRDDAMDLVQEATVHAYRGFHTFTPGTNFRAWFLRVLTNRYLKGRPRAARERALLALEEAEDIYLYRMSRGAGLSSDGDPASAVLDRLDGEAVQAALDMLPDEFRTVAILALVDEATYEDISEMLGIPIGTVRSRLHRGRKLLQKALWQVALARGLVSEEAGHA
jgi:RNA polymerase sigma-70 factor (ECF subfamily)